MSALVDTSTGEIVEPLDEDEARELTDGIKSLAVHLWDSLVEAHDRRAWAALGYRSWSAYIESEFEFTRNYAYRVVNQGRVIHELRGAVAEVLPTGNAPDVTLTEREARDVKPHLTAVTDKVRQTVTHETTTTGTAPTADRVQAIVDEVVTETRTDLQREVQDREARAAKKLANIDPAFVRSLARDPDRIDREQRVINAIRVLADTEDVDDLAADWPAEANHHLDRIEEAAWVLNRLRDARKGTA